MTTGRGIDHIGIATRNLDRLAAQYEALGFTLTPRAYHQDHMGTSNRLLQFGTGVGLGRNFIELLEVDRPQTMLPHSPGFMGFGQFSHDFLKRREGMSLIIFRTDDTAADLAAWKAKGLDVYDQFNFERQAVLPDGSEATVRFELGFVTHPDIDVLFYVCDNKAEDRFWKPEYQSHANGAEEIEAIVLSDSAPERHAPFLSALFDGEVTQRDGGISVSFAEHRIDVVRPDALPDAAQPALPDGSAAGFVARSPSRAGSVTPASEAGGAFIQWTR
ncbi:MAG: VOC family protein [Paracoccaceae bacterium]